MQIRVCLCVLLFIATATGIEDSLTMIPFNFSSIPVANSTIPSISVTSTPAIPSSATANGSFTIFPLSSTLVSTLVPSNTVSPTLIPPPPQQNSCYSVNKTKDKPCVLLCVKQPIRLISNFTEGNGTVYDVTVPIPGPNGNGATVSGFCPKSINSNFARSGLIIAWSVSSDINFKLELTFVLNLKKNDGQLGDQDVWFLESATYDYHNVSSEFKYSLNLTNGTETETITSNLRRAYTCDKPHLFYLKNNPTIPTVTVTIMNITQYTLQPFALNLTEHEFTYIETCKPGGIPLFVPVVVAGILSGFVLILMFLYVIGRFRTKKKVQYERLS